MCDNALPYLPIGVKRLEGLILRLLSNDNAVRVCLGFAHAQL
jgi:hypothetical protein